MVYFNILSIVASPMKVFWLAVDLDIILRITLGGNVTLRLLTLTVDIESQIQESPSLMQGNLELRKIK
jgi:hypothetical protein